MKISEIKMNVIECTVPSLFTENDITVQSTMYSIFHPEEPRKYDIRLSGWSCLSPEQVRMYAEELNKAAGICEALNNLELTIDPEKRSNENISSGKWAVLRKEARAYLMANDLDGLKKYLMED